MAFTTVSAIMRDSDGQNWIRGSWKLEFIPNPTNPNIAQYQVDGTSPLAPAVISQSGVMDNTGYFSLVLYDNTSITPIGSSWKLTVCPLSSAACGFYVFSAAGTSLDISGALTFLMPAPRFYGVYPNYGYNDTEVILSNKPGSTYYNVVLQAQKYYNDQTATWAIVGTGPTGPPGLSGNPSTIINGAQDPNVLTASGIYILPDGLSGSNAPNPPHTFDSRGGVLEVFNFAGTPTQAPYIYQRFQSSNDASQGGGWSPGESFTRWYCDVSNVMQWTGWNIHTPGYSVFGAAIDPNNVQITGIYLCPMGLSGGGAPNPPGTWNSTMGVLEVVVYQGSLQHFYIQQKFYTSQDTFAPTAPGRWFMRWMWWNGTAEVWSQWFYYMPAGTA